MNKIAEAKARLPLPELMSRLGLGDHAKKSALCPFHDDHHNSFSAWQNGEGWAWKCHAGCGAGDEINFIESHEALSRKEAVKRFLEMAGVNGATPKSTSTLDWPKCGGAFTDQHIQALARWRGYTTEFVRWLKENGLIGIYDGRVATPVVQSGSIIGAHYRLKDGTWRYFPLGIKAQPLVFGELVSAEPIHCFESTWDGLDYMDKSGERDGVIIARGAGNARLAAALIPQGAMAYVWAQNDKPGADFERELVANAHCSVKRCKIPARYKDFNDWTRAGATAEDLFAAVQNAEELKSVQPFECSDESSETAQCFPLHCLPSQIEAMAKAVCATERVPESLAGCCALGILSASIGAGLQVSSGPSRCTRGNLYLLVSGQSGCGKSESFRHLARPFHQFEIERRAAWTELTLPGLLAERDILESEISKLKKAFGRTDGGNRASLRSQLEVKRAAWQDLQQRLQPPDLSCEDVTTEKLVLLLAHNDEQLASLSPDALSIVNILLGRYSKLERTDESVYLKAFSGDMCRVDRVSRDSVLLESPCLTACWLTQPDKLDSLLVEQSLSDGGLIPRVLACHTNCEPREIIDEVPTVPPSVSTAYGDLIRTLLETYRLAPQPFFIRSAPEALRAMNRHHNAIVTRRRGELRDVTSFAARWNEQAWRVAVCLHAGTHGAVAHQHQLELETAIRAITLADWFATQQLLILKAGRAERKAERLQKLRELIVQQYNGTATMRALYRNNGFEAAETRELAAQFSDVLVIEKRETGGRPSEIVRLHKK